MGKRRGKELEERSEEKKGGDKSGEGLREGKGAKERRREK